MCSLMALGSRIECHASKNNLFDHWEQRSMILTLSYPDSPTPLQAGEVSLRSPANSGCTQHGHADAHRRTQSHF